MDKERLPQWGWLLIGLFATAILAQLINAIVLFPLGLPLDFQVVTIIAAMAPVLVYTGMWYEGREQYWNKSRAHIYGDVIFVVTGAALGAAIVALIVLDFGISGFIADVLAMFGGFLLAYGMFWFRNTDLFGDSANRR